MSESSSNPSSPLPPPQGYVAEKVSILIGAIKTALRRMGLAVTTVDDSIRNPQTPTSAAVEPVVQDSPRVQVDSSSALKVPGLHSFGQTVERALQDAADFSESHAMHVAHEAMEEDRLHRHITL